jgi:hypothetical protein
VTTQRRLAIAVCTIAALVLVAALPPRPAPDKPTILTSIMGFQYYGGWWGRGDRHRQTVERTARLLARRVRAREHGASVVRGDGANRRSIASERESLRVVYDAGIPSSAAREWLASAERELALYPRSGAGIPVVIELAAVWPYPGNRWSEPNGIGRMVVEGPRPTCLVTRFFSREVAQKNAYGIPVALRGVVLDQCALYARYGLPGGEVRNWLGLGEAWANTWYSTGVSVSLRRATWRTLPDTVEWFRTGWWVGEALSAVQCLRGNDSTCEAVAAIRPTRNVLGSWYGSSLFAAERVAASLLTAQPTEAFVRFWRSDLPVAEALASAYGAPAGALVRRAMSRQYVAPARAHTGVGKLLLAPAWILVALGLAWVGSRRKEVVT